MGSSSHFYLHNHDVNFIKYPNIHHMALHLHKFELRANAFTHLSIIFGYGLVVDCNRKLMVMNKDKCETTMQVFLGKSLLVYTIDSIDRLGCILRVFGFYPSFHDFGKGGAFGLWF